MLSVLKPRIDAYSAHVNRETASKLQRSRQAKESLDWAVGSNERLPTVRETTNLALLGVHPAISLKERSAGSAEHPSYVERDIDQEIIDSLRGLEATGGIVAVVGPAAAGKTRTAYETVLKVFPDWKLLIPPSGMDLLHLTESEAVPSRTIVWLDEADRFFEGAPQVARAIRRIILDPGKAVIFVATLWPGKLVQLTRGPGSDHSSHESVITDAASDSAMYQDGLALASAERRYAGHVKDVIRLAQIHDLPPWYSQQELRRATRLAETDPRLAEALRLSVNHELARALAAAPALIRKIANPDSEPGSALLRSAIDLRRAGHPAALPEALLSRMAEILYLSPYERARLRKDWFLAAVEWATVPVSGKVAALMPRADRIGQIDGYEVSDILVEWSSRRGRVGDPNPDLFWDVVAEQADPTACLPIGKCALDEGFEAAAEKAWGRAAGAGKPAGMYNLALLAYRRGQEDKFLHWHKKAWSCGHVESATDLGYHFSESGDLAAAERWYSRAAEKGDVRAAYNLGLLLLDSGRESEAAEWYAKAVEAGDTDSMVNLAYIYNQQGKSEEATALYTKAAHGGNSMAMSNLGLLMSRKGEYEEAQRWYRQAIELGYARAVFGLAAVQAELGDHDNAIQSYMRAIDSGEPRAWNNLGLLYQRLGLREKARAALRSGAESGDNRAMANLGALYLEEGEKEEASVWFERGRSAGGHLALLLHAQLLIAEGAPGEPMRWLDEALELGDDARVMGIVYAFFSHRRFDIIFEYFQRLSVLCGQMELPSFLLLHALVVHPEGRDLLTEWVAQQTYRTPPKQIVIAAVEVLSSMGKPDAAKHQLMKAIEGGDGDWAMAFALSLLMRGHDDIVEDVVVWCSVNGYNEGVTCLERIRERHAQRSRRD
ncbi:tetratricopeptide repeat protein [Micromonospora sp. HNM0581]|uniref:tetratricopeptide repeat protein n=1 Tax=Micromonospora sp. HNM0581 TaxID=2716341 RepID=UPI00146E57D8|nr:tetratricopeptide repeat protein [Micromonospora sp. HNM0581]